MSMHIINEMRDKIRFLPKKRWTNYDTANLDSAENRFS